MAKTKRKPVTDQDIIKDWLPLAVVMDELGASERTVNRMTERGELQQGYLRVPARRPAPVFNPEDVKNIKAAGESAKLSVMPRQATMPIRSLEMQTATDGGAILDALPALTEFTTAVLTAARLTEGSHSAPSAYVELDEAAAISGLPKAYLLQEAKRETLKAMKLGRWYFQRKALQEM